MKLILYFSFFFFLTELLIALKKYRFQSDNITRKDRLSLLIFWLFIPLGITAAFMTASYETWQLTEIIRAVIGVVIALSGLLIRWIAIRQLQKQFTVNVVLVDAPQLITSGLYQYVRHPAYLGLWLFAFGLGLAMNSWVSLLIIVTAFTLAIYYRIYIEESLLQKAFGTSYGIYRKQTPKLFPFYRF